MPISFRHMCSLEISLDQSTVAISGNYLEHHNTELFFVFVCCFDATAMIRTQNWTVRSPLIPSVFGTAGVNPFHVVGGDIMSMPVSDWFIGAAWFRQQLLILSTLWRWRCLCLIDQLINQWEHLEFTVLTTSGFFLIITQTVLLHANFTCVCNFSLH